MRAGISQNPLLHWQMHLLHIAKTLKHRAQVARYASHGMCFKPAQMKCKFKFDSSMSGFLQSAWGAKTKTRVAKYTCRILPILKTWCTVGVLRITRYSLSLRRWCADRRARWQINLQQIAKPSKHCAKFARCASHGTKYK